MKCEYCGKELPVGATVCDGCGAKYESNVPVNQGVNNFDVSNNSNGSKKGGSKVIIIVLAIVILALIGVVVWLVVGNNSSESSNEEKNPVEDKDEEKEEDKPNYEGLKTITFGKYTLSVPKGFETGIENNNPYIVNSECLIMYVNFSLNYAATVSNKDTFIQSLEASGMKINSFETKKINGQDYIIMKGVMDANNAEFGYMITDVGGDTPILLTILSSKLSSFEDDWFDYGAQFIESARK